MQRHEIDRLVDAEYVGEEVRELDGVVLKSSWFEHCDACQDHDGRGTCGEECNCMCHAHPGCWVKELRPGTGTVIMSAMNTKYSDREVTTVEVRKDYRQTPYARESSMKLMARSVKKP